MPDRWFDDMRDLCDATILDILGDTVAYQPGGAGPSYDIAAHFQNPFEAFTDGNAGAAASRPRIDIRLESLPVAPAKGDLVVIPSPNVDSARPRFKWKVIEKQPNGQGGCYLYLHVVGPVP